MNMNLEEFISKCSRSSNQAYELFKEVLHQLENPDSRTQTLKFLFQLTDYYQKHDLSEVNFTALEQSVLNHNDEAIPLKLLQFPSTFLPEAWSFTFYEGLIRYRKEEYHEKKVVELGCGIGWISLAIALRYGPQKMYGLDINPKAITCAKLNLYLNSFDHEGSPKLLANGKSLLDIVSFRESNLFACFKGEEVTFDKIVGCIPQVLNPNPEAMEAAIVETASDEYLHSLSNYFAEQGFIEDQFGLGLIASTVEQAIPILKSDGSLILNLGGRPGRNVLENLMKRRGFKVRRVWQTQVEQAADTEIDALVEIEKKSKHRFEFYMSHNPDTPIDARTAKKYADAGGKIFHSVDVYEAQMLFPEHVKNIYESIDKIGNRENTSIRTELRNVVDLTYDNIEDAEERYSFLAFLARQLQTTHHFPYDETKGSKYFRQQIAEFFKYYLRLTYEEDHIFITPERKQFLNNLLTTYQPKLTIIDKAEEFLVDPKFDTTQTEILKAPSKVEYLIELIRKLKPELVVCKLSEHEIHSYHLVEELINSSKELGALLVLDITDSINLSSQAEQNGLFKYLSEAQIPSNLILMSGLINNNVYQNFSLNITLTKNKDIINHLTDAAELTYSRTPIIKQLYYAHLLEELLFFQRTRQTYFPQEKSSTSSTFSLNPSQAANQAFKHPAIKGNHLPFNDLTIRLDYGENELPTPASFKEAIYEGHLIRNFKEKSASPEKELLSLLSKRLNIPEKTYSKMVFGIGAAPIYASLLDICKKKEKTFIIPKGSYGYFKAAAEYKDLNLHLLETKEEQQFKVTPEELEQALKKYPNAWLFLNAPIINPTGMIYSQSELTQLLDIAKKHGATIIMDCVFMGLEFEEDPRWDLSKFYHSEHLDFVIIGGISKEYAAGGLRFGYAWSTSKNIIENLELEITDTPHFTLGHSIKSLVRSQLKQEPVLHDHLKQQKQELQTRAQTLTKALENKGWDVLPPQGGLFLVAKPTKFIKENKFDLTKGADQMTSRLFKEQNIVVNNSTWTGLPGYCRFVFSNSKTDFLEAIERISKM